jgi:hypothetical protein
MKKKWVTGKDLIADLSIGRDDLIDLISKGKLSPYNELHTLLTKEQFNQTLLMGFSYRDELLDSFIFKTAEIEQLKKDTSENNKLNGNPVLYFFKKGDYWFIGNDTDKINPLKKMKGFEHIHFLLKHEGEGYSPLVVYHNGNDFPDDLKVDEISFQEKGDLKARTTCLTAIEDLQQKLAETTNEETCDDLNDKIIKLKNYLNSLNHNLNPSFEKARQTVTTNIKNALSYLHKERPYLKGILNKKSIETGNQCSYKGSSLKWILDPA